MLLCWLPVAENADTGCRAHHCAVGSGLWGKGVWETGTITLCGGFGKAEKCILLYARGCRESEETESQCFWTSLGIKLGLWEGRGR